jgi:hypothetical protein
MRGYHVSRRGGWDTHGLPVEIEVEKQLGFTSKSQIEEYGIDRFNELCRKSVFTYIQEWEKLTDRIAFWVDLEDAYVTYTNDYIESVWWILKNFWDKGLLYQGYKVVPYCPRCGRTVPQPAIHADGASIVTVEGLASRPVQRRLLGEPHAFGGVPRIAAPPGGRVSPLAVPIREGRVSECRRGAERQHGRQRQRTDRVSLRHDGSLLAGWAARPDREQNCRAIHAPSTACGLNPAGPT